MVNLTAKWSLPLFVDTDIIDPLQTPLGLMSTATDAAISAALAQSVPGVLSGVIRDGIFPAGVVKQGDRVYRIDLGYEEAYYGLYSVSNPGGRAVAGWAPVASEVVGSNAPVVGWTFGYNVATRNAVGNVLINIQANKGSVISDNDGFAYVPLGFRPAQGVEISGATSQGGNAQACFISIGTDGVCRVFGAGTGNQKVSFSTVYKAAP